MFRRHPRAATGEVLKTAVAQHPDPTSELSTRCPRALQPAAKAVALVHRATCTPHRRAVPNPVWDDASCFTREWVLFAIKPLLFAISLALYYRFSFHCMIIWIYRLNCWIQNLLQGFRSCPSMFYSISFKPHAFSANGLSVCQWGSEMGTSHGDW